MERDVSNVTRTGIQESVYVAGGGDLTLYSHAITATFTGTKTSAPVSFNMYMADNNSKLTFHPSTVQSTATFSGKSSLGSANVLNAPGGGSINFTYGDMDDTPNGEIKVSGAFDCVANAPGGKIYGQNSGSGRALSCIVAATSTDAINSARICSATSGGSVDMHDVKLPGSNPRAEAASYSWYTVLMLQNGSWQEVSSGS